MPVRNLSADDLARALPMSAAIDAMEEAFRLPKESYCVPPRTQIAVPESRTKFFFMPALAQALGYAGIKIASLVPENPESGLPPVQGTYALFSIRDGRLVCTMDGAYLTAIRTAATSAVATRRLAREDARCLGIFGTGAQARFHLEAMLEVRKIREVLVCGSSPEKARSFARSARAASSIPVRAASAEETARADLICTCTNSHSPVFDGALLTEGAHINSIGAFVPERREIDDEVARRARIFLEERDGVMSEAGDILIPLANGSLRSDQIVGDLSQLVREEIRARLSERDITVFKSVGYALEDIIAAARAYEHAVRSNLGQQFIE